MNDNQQSNSANRPPLAQRLIDNKIISQAQADLAVADQEITGLPLAEVLLLRGWIDQQTLDKLAPAAQTSITPVEPPKVSSSAAGSYEENSKAYRQLIRRILGGGWD